MEESLRNIDTDRLILMPVTLEITRSLIHGSTDELKRLGVGTDTGWPTQDLLGVLPMITKSLEKDRIPSGFEFWMIVNKDDMVVIGDIGFHGKPNEKGEVEVGFGLVPHQRGKGYGSESLKAIMNWLSSQDVVAVVKAQCVVSNKPSARILEKVGMREVSRDDKMIYWECVKVTAQ